MRNAVCVLVGTKTDLRRTCKTAVTPAEGKRLAAEEKMEKYVECSSLLNVRSSYASLPFGRYNFAQTEIILGWGKRCDQRSHIMQFPIFLKERGEKWDLPCVLIRTEVDNHKANCYPLPTVLNVVRPPIKLVFSEWNFPPHFRYEVELS